jgi:hypothetical protein
MTTQTEALDQLIECARLLGTTQAKQGTGTYTREDSRFECVMHEAIAKHSATIKEALAQPEQEPVESCNGMPAYEGPLSKTQRKQLTQELNAPLTLNGVALYPQSEWVGLTDEEIAEVAERMEATDSTHYFWREFARAIEAAHGIGDKT